MLITCLLAKRGVPKVLWLRLELEQGAERLFQSTRSSSSCPMKRARRTKSCFRCGGAEQKVMLSAFRSAVLVVDHLLVVPLHNKGSFFFGDRGDECLLKYSLSCRSNETGTARHVLCLYIRARQRRQHYCHLLWLDRALVS